MLSTCSHCWDSLAGLKVEELTFILTMQRIKASGIKAHQPCPYFIPSHSPGAAEAGTLSYQKSKEAQVAPVQGKGIILQLPKALRDFQRPFAPGLMLHLVSINQRL